jgi:hypothetical protein
MAVTSGGKPVLWGTSILTNLLPLDLGPVAAIASGDYHCLALTPKNFEPTALARTVTCKTDADFVFALLARDPNADPLQYFIASLPSKGALYQYSTSGRGAPITTPGLVQDSEGRLIFVPEASASGAHYDSFTFCASDGEFQSNIATNSISLAPEPEVQLIGFSGQDTNLALSLSFTGVPNLNYLVQGSKDLRSWSTIVTTQSAAGSFVISDRGVTNQAARFYRVRTWP